jgi:hypothetical protein
MMTGRVDTGATYRVGRGGVRITWRDGSTTSHLAGTTFVLDRPPLKIEGRLFRVTRRGTTSYEAPALTADHG